MGHPPRPPLPPSLPPGPPFQGRMQDPCPNGRGDAPDPQCTEGRPAKPLLRRGPLTGRPELSRAEGTSTDQSVALGGGGGRTDCRGSVEGGGRPGTPVCLTRTLTRTRDIHTTEHTAAVFWNQRVEGGSEKSSFAVDLVKKKIGPFLALQKMFGTFGVRVHNN